MPQVIIVSNRLPVSVKREDGKLVFYPSLGGLATGLASYAKDRNTLWIGWPGIPSDDLTPAERKAIIRELEKHRCAPVFLAQKELDEFYSGYSNTILWPLFHSLRVPQASAYQRWWRTYQQVNRQFTDIIASHASGSSAIWVHDYQLLLVPHLLRQQKIKGHVGFFLHIPFPSSQTFAKLPEAKQLLEGLLGADLVGFHTSSYVSTFFGACSLLLNLHAANNQLIYRGRLVRATEFPMGIDYEKYAAAGKNSAVKAAVKKYRSKYRGYKVIVTVDRLDPSKGLLERIEAYRLFLEQHPEFHKQVILCMVAAPSRTDVVAYQRLKTRLEKAVTEINATYGTQDWQPVDYIQGLPFEEVTALFRVADVAFIAPLRDGMNLVAKEFVASSKMHGALILSETAGAAEELRDALLVDPKQTSSVVSALYEALTMPRREIRIRLKRMQRYLSDHTVHTWATTFMSSLNQPLPALEPKITKTINPRIAAQLKADYQKASSRLLFIDYDGTLVAFGQSPHDATPTHHLKQLLQKLADYQRSEVVVISGRSKQDLQDWLGDLPVSLVAEHGAFIKKRGQQQWRNQYDPVAATWKQTVRPIMAWYAAETPGAELEEKSQSLVWHYRQASPYYAQKNSVIMRRVLRPILKAHNLKLYSGHKIVEVKDPVITKGKAIQHWLSKEHGFILALGDDYTDEDVFEAVPFGSYSIKVGTGRSQARYRVPTVDAAQELLQTLLD